MKKHATVQQSLSSTDISTCTTVAVDLAKQVFYEERIKSREAFHTFLRQLPPTVVVLIETGPGAQAWARQLQAQGRLARILPAQLVAKHRSGAKNHRNDAQAILCAGRNSIEPVCRLLWHGA